MLYALLLLLLAAACSALAEPAGIGAAYSGKWQSANMSPTASEPTAAGPFAKGPAIKTQAAAQVAPTFAPATIRKLTVEQYVNSVRDLLGQELQLPPEISLESDVAQNGFYAVAASTATISPAAAETLEQAAYTLAAQALNPSCRDRLVSCWPNGVSDAVCAQSFLSELGQRAFRRPLDAAELGRYVAVAGEAAQALGNFYKGLEFAVAGIIQSPHFLFRVELGEPDPSDPKRLRYTDFQLATRLSYALWNTTPDSVLLNAAASGELRGSGLGKQAARLMSDPRALRALNNFHTERLDLSELATLNKDPKLVGALSNDLRDALRADVLETFAEFSGFGRDFLRVFDTRVAYVNAELSTVYGLDPQPGARAKLTRVELPNDGKRVGFVGKPALLALAAHGVDTSPTLRGKYLRERVLCERIPAPPKNVVTVLCEPDPSAPTLRDRLRVHATDPNCAGCHSQMDPLGLSLEHFDTLGRYRATDHGHVLDTRGEIDGVSFDGEAQLALLLRDDPRTAECLVRQAYRYALGHIEEPGEEPLIQALLSKFVYSGHDLSALFQSIVTSDAFRYAGKDAP